MSILLRTRGGHPYISTSFNASHLRAIPAWDAAEIRRSQLSNGRSSAMASTNGSIDDAGRNIAREERSFITNGACYANKRAHWLNAVGGSKTLANKIAKHLVKLGVVNLVFTLDDPSNLVNLDPMLHSAMNRFGLIAVTLSLESLAELIRLFDEENRAWQDRMDAGDDYVRKFSVFKQAFASATYELIILHPKHFLPCRSVLPIYSGPEDTPTFYQVASDGVLRQSPASVESLRLPPFLFNSSCRDREVDHLNPLLVAMAAQIKFRRYDRSGWPPLEEHTRLLMDKTTTLVDAIYWKPAGYPTPQPKAKTSPTKRGDRDDSDERSQAKDKESREETAIPAPAGRNRSGQGVRTRSSRSKDTSVNEELMSDSSDESEITMDEMFDMMSGPNDHELDEHDRAFLDSLWTQASGQATAV